MKGLECWNECKECLVLYEDLETSEFEAEEKEAYLNIEAHRRLKHG